MIIAKLIINKIEKGENAMKRLSKVFLGMLLSIFFLFAYSHASDKPIPLTTKNQVTFMWKAVATDTSGKLFGKNDGKVMYVVYTYQAKNIDETPPIKKKDIDKKNLKEISLIDKTNHKISFDSIDKGLNFYLGVQACLYKEVSKDGKPIGKPINESDISWSCFEADAKNNPHYVHVSK